MDISSVIFDPEPGGIPFTVFPPRAVPGWVLLAFSDSFYLKNTS